MKKDWYALFSECFPAYPAAREKAERELFTSDHNEMICEYVGGELVGTAITQGCGLMLLCVAPDFRRRGVGGRLLARAEEAIRQSGEKKAVLGIGDSFLFQGAPTDDPACVPFFEKHGYAATWTSVNMRLDLNGYDVEAAARSIPPAPENLVFRMAEQSDRAALLEAVKCSEEGWLPLFEDMDTPTLLAVLDGRVAGYEMLEADGSAFPPGDGAIGCVGVAEWAQKRGIGRRMVLEGVRRLQNGGCRSVELLYVALVNWYGALGFTVCSRQWMGEKAL